MSCSFFNSVPDLSLFSSVTFFCSVPLLCFVHNFVLCLCLCRCLCLCLYLCLCTGLILILNWYKYTPGTFQGPCAFRRGCSAICLGALIFDLFRLLFVTNVGSMFDVVFDSKLVHFWTPNAPKCTQTAISNCASTTECL